MNEEFSIHTAPIPSRGSTRIVEAARNRFLQYGYHKTSMREIADDCAMSAANLYRFYPGKLAIAAAVVEDDRRRLFEACDASVAAAQPNPAARLAALFLTIVDRTRHQIQTEPLLFELGLIVARTTPESRLSLLSMSRQRIASILGAESPVEQSSSASLDVAVSVVHLASAPFVLPWMLANQPFGDVRARVHDLAACLVRGLPTTSPTPAAP